VTGARRTGVWRVAAAVAGAAVALWAVGLAVASASQLTVTSAPLVLQNTSRCTEGPIVVVPEPLGSGNDRRDAVTLWNVPLACAGLPVSLVLYRSTGNVLVTGIGDVPPSPGIFPITFPITTATYRVDRVSGVALLIGTWGIPATWSTTPPPPVDPVISLRSHANNMYVTADPAGALPLIASSTTIGTSQEFDLITNANGSVSLRAHANNMYVCAENAGTESLIANRAAIALWEEFDLINNPDGSISLRSRASTMYVTAEDAGASPLIANRTLILAWEEFDLIIN
jgi:hypothetical protein